MTVLIGLLLLGVVAGALSGLIGIGGGVVIVPALVFLFHFTQKQAQGTTLALLIPPIGIIAAVTYYKAGYVDVKAAGLIVAGFLVGSLLGARYATHISDIIATRIFGSFLLLLALKLLIFTK
jgi:uncharacterized protein